MKVTIFEACPFHGEMMPFWLWLFENSSIPNLELTFQTPRITPPQLFMYEMARLQENPRFKIHWNKEAIPNINDKDVLILASFPFYDWEKNPVARLLPNPRLSVVMVTHAPNELLEANVGQFMERWGPKLSICSLVEHGRSWLHRNLSHYQDQISSLMPVYPPFDPTKLASPLITGNYLLVQGGFNKDRRDCERFCHDLQSFCRQTTYKLVFMGVVYGMKQEYFKHLKTLVADYYSDFVILLPNVEEPLYEITVRNASAIIFPPLGEPRFELYSLSSCVCWAISRHVPLLISKTYRSLYDTYIGPSLLSLDLESLFSPVDGASVNLKLEASIEEFKARAPDKTLQQILQSNNDDLEKMVSR